MHSTKNWLQTALAVALGAALLAPAMAQQPEAVNPEGGAHGIQHAEKLFELAVGGQSAHGYWIGVSLAPADDDAKAAAKVEHGLVVSEVIEGSPAAVAGVKVDDVIIKLGGEDVAGVKALAAAIDEAKEKEIELTVVRDGKKQKIEVTPARRPQDNMIWRPFSGPLGGPVPLGPDGEVDEERFREWLKKFPQQPGRMMFFGPGVAVPNLTLKGKQEHPKGLSIQVTKNSEKPATIEVKQDGKTWKTTADKLDELPKEIRPHVEQLLGRGFGAADIDFHIQRLQPLQAVPGKRPAQALPVQPRIKIAPGNPVQPRIEVRGFTLARPQEQGDISELRDEIKQLRKDVDRILKAIQSQDD